jgi:hypothetical protein
MLGYIKIVYYLDVSQSYSFVKPEIVNFTIFKLYINEISKGNSNYKKLVILPVILTPYLSCMQSGQIHIYECLIEPHEIQDHRMKIFILSDFKFFKYRRGSSSIYKYTTTD